MSGNSDKDYAAIVKRDWDGLSEAYKATLRDYLSGTIDNRFPELANKYDSDIKRKVAIAVTIDGVGIPNKNDIAEILKGFPNDCILDICKVIKPKTLENYWESGFSKKKLELARLNRKQLKGTIKKLPSVIKVLNDHFTSCELSRGYPGIVKDPLYDAVCSLGETLALANAYCDLFDAELEYSHTRKDGGDYDTPTRDPIWNQIIVNIVNLLKPALKKYGVAKEQDNYYSFAAKLLITVYPKYWGDLNHDAATQRVRERYEGATK